MDAVRARDLEELLRHPPPPSSNLFYDAFLRYREEADVGSAVLRALSTLCPVTVKDHRFFAKVDVVELLVHALKGYKFQEEIDDVSQQPLWVHLLSNPLFVRHRVYRHCTPSLLRLRSRDGDYLHHRLIEALPEGVLPFLQYLKEVAYPFPKEDNFGWSGIDVLLERNRGITYSEGEVLDFLSTVEKPSRRNEDAFVVLLDCFRRVSGAKGFFLYETPDPFWCLSRSAPPVFGDSLLSWIDYQRMSKKQKEEAYQQWRAFADTTTSGLVCVNRPLVGFIHPLLHHFDLYVKFARRVASAVRRAGADVVVLVGESLNKLGLLLELLGLEVVSVPFSGNSFVYGRLSKVLLGRVVDSLRPSLRPLSKKNAAVVDFVNTDHGFRTFRLAFERVRKELDERRRGAVTYLCIYDSYSSPPPRRKRLRRIFVNYSFMSVFYDHLFQDRCVPKKYHWGSDAEPRSFCNLTRFAIMHQWASSAAAAAG